MDRHLHSLSRGMLVLGGLLILAGVGWGIWARVDTPPEPQITEAGAVVLAVTAPLEASPTPSQPETAFTPSPPIPTARAASISEVPGPAPELLPEFPEIEETSESVPTARPAGASSGGTPSPTSEPAPATEPVGTSPGGAPSPTPDSTPTPPLKITEPPTRIVAPSIKLDAPVVPMGWEMVDSNGTLVAQWVVPKKAAGWHENSALPGHGGNVVLSGHHNIEGKVFRYVVDLALGAEITLNVGDTPYVYTVTEKYILKEAGMSLAVRKKNAQWIMPTEDERLTLVTCWPYEYPGNSHRVIVVAKPQNTVHLREEGY